MSVGTSPDLLVRCGMGGHHEQSSLFFGAQRDGQAKGASACAWDRPGTWGHDVISPSLLVGAFSSS